jgi:hypothetical protein
MGSSRHTFEQSARETMIEYLCLCRIPHLQALFLKTADSVALPIYQVLPDAPTKIEQ